MAKVETQAQKDSRLKLEGKLKKETDRMIGSILSIFEVTVEEKNRLEQIKAQVKRIINDTRRSIEKELERQYLIEYVSTVDDVIVFNNSKLPR